MDIKELNDKLKEMMASRGACSVVMDSWDKVLSQDELCELFKSRTYFVCGNGVPSTEFVEREFDPIIRRKHDIYVNEELDLDCCGLITLIGKCTGKIIIDDNQATIIVRDDSTISVDCLGDSKVNIQVMNNASVNIDSDDTCQVKVYLRGSNARVTHKGNVDVFNRGDMIKRVHNIT